jgi:hypothetical protein
VEASVDIPSTQGYAYAMRPGRPYSLVVESGFCGWIRRVVDSCYGGARGGHNRPSYDHARVRGRSNGPANRVGHGLASGADAEEKGNVVTTVVRLERGVLERDVQRPYYCGVIVDEAMTKAAIQVEVKSEGKGAGVR